MKILYVIDSLEGGGAEKLINDLLPELTEEYQAEVLILTDLKQKYMTNLQERGIQVWVVPKAKKTFWKRFCYIRTFIMEGHYDIVHANLFPVTYFCSLAKKTSKTKFPKLVMTEHSTDNKRRHYKIFRLLEKWIYRSYDSVISISEKTQEALLSWLRIREENRGKFVVIDNGVPLKQFDEARAYKREDIISSCNAGEIWISMVGTLSARKNHDLALRIMKQLPEKYHLLLVGEGPLSDVLKAKVSQMNLEKRIHFLGFRKDLAPILKAVDLAIVPSKWEGFGLVAIEAMACGKPVVVSNVPGLAEVVGDHGLLAQLDDVDDFVRCILLLEDKKEYTRYSLKACKRSEVFDISVMCEKYSQLYSELIKEG